MAPNKLEVQRLFYPRTLKGVRQLDVTEHAAERRKDGPKVKTERKEDVRWLTHYVLIMWAETEDSEIDLF